MSQMVNGAGVSLSPLLRSKLRAPANPDYFVPRDRLNGLLDRVVHSPLTLVVAPAGSGKSQLVSNWIDTIDLKAAWHSNNWLPNAAAMRATR